MDLQPCDILIVEDSPADAELMVRALRRSHFANPITVVEDGAAALEYLLGDASRGGSPPPRVVLLDLKLPKVSGLEVLRRIREHEALRSLPVVMVTSSREEPDIDEAYRLGVNSYVVKPVDYDRFVEAVRQLGLYWLLVNEPPVSSTASVGQR